MSLITIAFPVSQLEGKRTAVVGLLEGGRTEPSGIVQVWVNRHFVMTRIYFIRKRKESGDLTYILCSITQLDLSSFQKLMCLDGIIRSYTLCLVYS